MAKYLLPLTLLLLLSTGCDNDRVIDLGPGVGTLSARIDGEAFSSEVTIARLDESTDDLAFLSLLGGPLANGDAGELIAISLVLGDGTLPRTATHTLVKDCTPTTTRACVGGGYTVRADSRADPRRYNTDTDDNRPSITFTYERYNRSGGEAVRGSFDMLVVSLEDSTSTVRITDGTFDVPLED